MSTDVRKAERPLKQLYHQVYYSEVPLIWMVCLVSHRLELSFLAQARMPCKAAG